MKLILKDSHAGHLASDACTFSVILVHLVCTNNILYADMVKGRQILMFKSTKFCVFWANLQTLVLAKEAR